MNPTTPVAGTFKVFNKGGRIFQLHELAIQPGQFTTVPPQHVEMVKKMINDYPTELESADSSIGGKNSAKTIGELNAQLAQKQKQIEKLQKILLDGDAAVLERAERAEEALKASETNLRNATERIRNLELTAANLAAKK